MSSIVQQELQKYMDEDDNNDKKEESDDKDKAEAPKESNK